jgi:hypothetical protein
VDLESTHRQKKLVVHSVEINQTLEYAFQQASASTSKRINKQAHQQASASTVKYISELDISRGHRKPPKQARV